MGWLVGYTLASMAASFVVVKIFDWLFAGVISSLVAPARAVLFVGTWTAVTAQAGMHGFSRRVRQVRQGHTKVIGALIKHVRP